MNCNCNTYHKYRFYSHVFHDFPSDFGQPEHYFFRTHLLDQDFYPDSIANYSLFLNIEITIRIEKIPGEEYKFKYCFSYN